MSSYLTDFNLLQNLVNPALATKTNLGDKVDYLNKIFK